MPAHTGRLLLTMQAPFALPDRTVLEAVLATKGFLGARLASRADAFLVGDRFLQLVTFAGCSVRVELSPTDGSPFCHIRIAGPFGSPIFVHGRNTRPPRCPICRSPLQDWKLPLALWEPVAAADIQCSACGGKKPPWDFDWKEKAGFGRLLVQVEDVFPGEATPTPELMNLLTRSAQGEWCHFYIQD